jgi:GNAT superfamily N-acetyltransferase
MPDKILDVVPGAAGRDTWNEIVNTSAEGWFWATRAMHEARVARFEASGLLVADRSFLLVRDGRARGLVPLVIGRDVNDGDNFASYLDAPLPWPMIGADAADRDGILLALFNELEARVVSEKAAMLRLMLAPPGVGSGMATTFAQIVRARGFVDVSYQSHYVDVNRSTLDAVRARYRRDVRKYWDIYRLDVLGPGDIHPSLAQIYMDLHIKDSGSFSRPLATYERQIGLVKNGEGFFVIARNLAADRIVGVLLISVLKGAAYDSSVAVDPEFAGNSVSHLMKWRAIQHLIERGVSHYELGVAAFAPTYMSQPSPKNYGISFFKDGWSRGLTKRVFQAEKFYSRDALDRFWERKRQALLEHFSI